MKLLWKLSRSTLKFQPEGQSYILLSPFDTETACFNHRFRKSIQTKFDMVAIPNGKSFERPLVILSGLRLPREYFGKKAQKDKLQAVA